ncbi:Rid family hydrolase [Mycolicibacterium litorale]|uniref:Rid family hydrolase n=1 Tax=Mycolicibacterium litorale TaxID=758802 RepID=UPI003CF3F557
MTTHGEGWCFITEAGHDPATGEVPDAPGEQTRLAIGKIVERLADAEMTLDDVILVSTYTTDPSYAPEIDAAMRESFSGPMPAAGPLLVVGLVDPRLKVEFHVTARRGARRR